jgi:hypothetical protein
MGDSIAAKWLAANPTGNYMSVFDANVTERDGGWALAWYEAICDKAVPRILPQPQFSRTPLRLPRKPVGLAFWGGTDKSSGFPRW